MTNYIVTGSDTAKDLLNFESVTVTVTGAISADIAAVNINGTNTLTNNAGMLSGVSGIAIRAFLGSGHTIINSGQITGMTAIWLTQSPASLANAKIINAGQITGTDSDAIRISSGGNSIVNTGTIVGYGGAAINIQAAFGPANVAIENRITNSGLIEGAFSGSDYTAILAQNNSDYVVNSGTIRGLINLNGGNNSLLNTGLIVGDVSTGTGSDKIINRGTIEGIVFLGTGSNTFDGRGGTVSGYVQGSTGSDLYRISDGSIILIEDAGAPDTVDSVFSSATYKLAENFEYLTLTGNDPLNGTGNSVRNLMDGNSADNRLSGLGGGDVMSGLAGDDRLNGGAGNDLLLGYDDNDTLLGGTGSDSLTGGDDRDLFVFLRRTDSPYATPDRITDFTSGDDRIDLSAFAGTLVFRGTGAYVAGVAQVRYVAGATTQVFIDTDGNATSDLRIYLTGNYALQASDFIL